MSNEYAVTEEDVLAASDPTSFDPYAIRGPAYIPSDRWVGRPIHTPIEEMFGGRKYLDLVEKNDRGKRGFFEEVFDVEAKDQPIVGPIAEVPYLYGIMSTAKRLNAGEPVSDQELLDLNKYHEYSRRKANQSFMAGVADVVQGSLALGTEIATTAVLSGLFVAEPVTTGAGVAIAGRRGARKIAAKGVQESIEALITRTLGKGAGKYARKGAELATRSSLMHSAMGDVVDRGTQKLARNLVGKKAANMAGRLVGVAADLESRALMNQLVNPQRTVRTVAERQLQNAIIDGDESVAASIAKGFMDMNFEYASEFSGEHIGNLARKVLPPKMIKKLGESALFQWVGINTGTTDAKGAWGILNTMGVQGAATEMAEERLGDFMRGLFGVRGEAGLVNAIEQSWPSGEQFATEAVAFSVMPIAANSFNKVSGGITYGEAAAATPYIQSLAGEADVFAKTEAEINEEARVLHEKLVEESQPWYKDSPFRFLEKVFGKERVGPIESSLKRAGVGNMRIVHEQAMEADPDNPLAGQEAIADYLRQLQRVQTIGIQTQEDVEAFNAGVKSGDIIQKEYGFIVEGQALTNPEIEKIRKKTGIKQIEDLVDMKEISTIGALNQEEITGTEWDKLTPDQKREYKLKWNSTDAAYLKGKYDLIRNMLLTGDMDGIEIEEALPVLYRGNEQEFRTITGYEITDKDYIYDKKDGHPRYVMQLGARTNRDGTQITLSTVASESSIVEDTIEAKMKQANDGINLTPEMNSWIDSVRTEIEGKSKQTENDKNILRMTEKDNDLGRFEFFVKNFKLKRLGYDGHPTLTANDKQFAGIEMPDTFDGSMRAIIGDQLTDVIALQPELVGRIERGERHERVRELAAERGAGGTAEARRLVSEAQGSALLTRLDEALNQDMRKAENRTAVNDILDEMDRSGETFALEEAYEASEEFAELKRAVETGTIRDIARASKRYWIKVPKPSDVTVVPKGETKAITVGRQPARRSVAEIRSIAERREPSGESIRREREGEYPDLDFTARVYTEAELRSVAPKWLNGEALNEWIETFGPNSDLESIARLQDEQPGRNPSIESMIAQLRAAPFELEATPAGGAPVAATSATPLSPESVQLPFDQTVEELREMAQEEREVDAIFNEEGTAAEQRQRETAITTRAVGVGEVGRGIERTYAENATVNPIWREQPMSRGRIDAQLESVAVVGGPSMSRLANTIAGKASTASGKEVPLRDFAWIPPTSDAKFPEPGIPRENRAAWWANRVGDVGTMIHHVKAMRGVFDENTQGWIAVIDNTENNLEERLGLPVQSLVHAARYGRHPMGDRAEIDTPIDETVDFFVPEGVLKGNLNTKRAAIYQIPASRLQDIANLRGADRSAAEDAYAESVRQWMIRNRVRNVGLAGYDQIIETPQGPQTITPEWQSAFAGIVNRAIGPDIVRRTTPYSEGAAPFSLTEAQISELETDLREGTFSLTPESQGLGARMFEAVRRFHNNRLSEGDADNFQAMIGRALQGNDQAKRQLRNVMGAADRAAFAGLLRTTEEAEALEDPTAGATPFEAQPVEAAEFELQTELDFHREMETNALESINSLTDTVAPTFVSGAPGFHRELLEINRKLRAQQFEENAFLDKIRDDLGLIGRRTDLPDDHVPQANEMLEAVTATLEQRQGEDIPDIPVRKLRDGTVETKSAQEISDRWDAYRAENNLDMPSVQELAAEMRKRFDTARQQANDMVKGLSDAEWIRYLDNYVSHYYRYQSDQNQREATNKMVEDTKSSKDRRIPTYQEAAQKYGLMPRTMNALEIYKSYNNVLTSATRNKALTNTASVIRDIDGAPIVIPIQNASLGPNDNTLVSESAQQQTLKHLSEYLQETYDASKPASEELARLVGLMDLEQNDYQRMDSPYTDSVDYFVVRKGLTTNLMKNVLNVGRVDNTVMRGIERFNAWSKFMMLSFSAFHPFALAESLSASFGIGLEHTEDQSLMNKAKRVGAGVAGNPVFHLKRSFQTITGLVKDMRENPQDYREWIEAGLMVNITNPDIKLGIVEKDIQNWMDRVGDDPGVMNDLQRGGIKAFQRYKEFLDRWLWNTFHPGVKMMAAENAFTQWQAMNPDSFEEQEKQVREQIAEYINNAFGGQEFDIYPWATPFAKQALHAVMFAPDWSLSAANVSGLTRLPLVNKLHATNLSPIARDQMLRKYWPAMTTIVLFGLPNMMQFGIWTASKVLGTGEPDDEPFTFMNEPGRKTHIDMTPLFRALPDNNGTQQGRRMYMRWGKQAYEISEGWLGDPRMILRKSSSIVRQAWETVTGNTVTGWELPFKDEGWAGIIAADGSVTEGRLGGVAKKFLPISLTSLAQGKPTAFIAPVSKGVTQGGVIYSMQKVLDSYVNEESMPKPLRHLQPQIVVAELTEAARRNGIDPKIAFNRARSIVASRYYKEFFEALNDQNDRRMEEAARKVVLLGRGMDDFHRSMEGRFEALDRIYSEEYKDAVQRAVTVAEE